METRRCAIHRNKGLDCFCWDCQSLVCLFCMQEHELRQHKVYSLRSLRASGKRKPATSSPRKETKKSRAGDAAAESRSGPKSLAEESKAPRPVEKKPEETVCCCVKCGKSANSKDVLLRCQHRAHRECLKEYARTGMERVELSWKRTGRRRCCSRSCVRGVRRW